MPAQHDVVTNYSWSPEARSTTGDIGTVPPTHLTVVVVFQVRHSGEGTGESPPQSMSQLFGAFRWFQRAICLTTQPPTFSPADLQHFKALASPRP